MLILTVKAWARTGYPAFNGSPFLAVHVVLIKVFTSLSLSFLMHRNTVKKECLSIFAVLLRNNRYRLLCKFKVWGIGGLIYVYCGVLQQ